jgi:hypothetical protein
MKEQMREDMIGILMKFCNDNDLPQDSADELILREHITDFQFGFLIAYCRIWDAMESVCES